MGALRRHIATQFPLESSLLGTVGGMIGTCLGILTITATALIQDWTPTIDPNISLLAPILGTVVGAAAGVYPAWKAANLQPAKALTTGV